MLDIGSSACSQRPCCVTHLIEGSVARAGRDGHAGAQELLMYLRSATGGAQGPLSRPLFSSLYKHSVGFGTASKLSDH